MKALSNPTVYAIRALIYIVSNEKKGQYINIKEITEKLEISFHLLTKTFQQLTQAGILLSYRGPGGGIALNKPASAIYLIDIVSILEGKDFFDKCMLGLPGCGELEPCPVHEHWSKIKHEIRQKYETTSLHDLKNLSGRIGLID